MEQRKLDLHQEVEIGYQTEVLLEKLKPYFRTMESQLIKGIRQCSVADVDALHNIKLQLHALDKLQLNLQSIIDTGKLANSELKDGTNGT